MMKANQILENKEALTNLADAVAYRCLENDDVLFVNAKSEFKVASSSKAGAYSYQGWTLCLDNLKSFLNRIETTDDGKEEAALISAWMLNQQ